MIRQLCLGLGGVALCGVALFVFVFGSSVPVLMAGVVLAIVGASAATWAVGLR